jgi:CheY-like chemotaxis protein
MPAKILFCSSDRLRRRAFEQVAVPYGILHTTVKNADEAWTLIQSDEGFTVIITDDDMPNMTGMELLRHVRTNFKTSTAELVLITVHTDSALEAEAKSLGITMLQHSREEWLNRLGKYAPES